MLVIIIVFRFRPGTFLLCVLFDVGGVSLTDVIN